MALGRAGGGFPAVRLRRWRRTEALRAMVREARIGPEHLVAPLFVHAGSGPPVPVGSLPGVAKRSADDTGREAARLAGLGVRHVLLFGSPAAKSPDAAPAHDPDGPVPRAIAAIRAASPDTVVWADVCACAYTDHGHCGILGGTAVDNDATVALLARIAVAYARAGADAVAPSDMMDGRVAAIRGALDAEGFEDTLLVSYAAKHASAFYGPFREAADSAPAFGDRRAYQMDPANAREALREMAQDACEGADMLMAKPGLPCLDLLAAARRELDLPLCAYHVSGEWAMLCAGAIAGWVDGDAVLMESLLALRRAGADAVITYGAERAARLLAGTAGDAPPPWAP